MEVNKCLLRSVHCAENPEGFSTTVSRDQIIRGPFATIAEAIRCAHGWSDGPGESDTPKDVGETALNATEPTP